MNLGKLTNIVSSVIKSRKDKTNKTTQLAMAINGTYVEDTTQSPADEEPTVTAPIFDSVDQVGSSFTASHFQLGDNMIFNVTRENTLISPLGILLTQEQRSKIGISLELNTNEYTQEDLLSETLMPIDKLGDAPFDIPENIAYILSTYYMVASVIRGDITDFTITYDGVDYVYNSTNMQITQQGE